MLPDLDTARAALETAQREAEEARALVGALAERVRDGDDAVTGADINAQRQLAEFAELRVTAAERKLAAAVDAHRDARARAAAERIRALVAEDSTDALCDAAQAVVTAVRALVRAADERADAIRAVAIEGVALNEELGRTQDDPWPSRRYDFMAQSQPLASVTAVGEGRATAVPTHRLLGIVLASALVDLGSMRTDVARAMGGTREGIQAAAEQVAGLAEALSAQKAQ
ncbi:hypothetical protein [Streptomyces sp. NPDC056632]|uniref:hypothetical protein n=1 Tax=Streptomyces sp. NPDC056632 TaxID=3345884 RepID=UPI0036C8126C